MKVKNWTTIVPVKEVKGCCKVTIGKVKKRFFCQIGDRVVCPACNRTWERGVDDIHLINPNCP
jgi:hypothetical protein